MPKQDKNIRRAAVSCLRAWAKGHDYAETLVERHATRNHLSTSDRGLLNAILLGVLRNRTLIDHWIRDVRFGKIDPETLDVLRVGVCQIVILQLPDHAAVNETVNCARAPVRGLINAVLRRIAHARARMIREMGELDPPLLYSHPQWLWKKWRKDFGPKNATALMAWNNQPAETFYRENPLRGGARRALQVLQAPSQNPPQESSAQENQSETPAPTKAEKAALMRDGHYYITDPSTAYAPQFLGAKPGEIILDACAAPGGKAAQMAADMQNQGTLICTDSNPKRLPRLQENLHRLGVTIAQSETHDWTQSAPEKWHAHFDAILLDVPCSNTGVLRRRVDARWRLQPTDIEKLVVLQRQILDQALVCLKPGGRLVYSTCSIDAQENSKQIKKLLTAYPELTLLKEKQILPFKHDTDGAYAALLHKE